MININVPKTELQATQLVLLHNFENELTDYARRLLNTSEFNQILLQILIDINPRKDNNIVNYSSDASFSIKNSLTFSDKLKDFVEKSEELEIILPKHSITISCHFSKKERQEAINGLPQSDASKAELPTFLPVDPKFSFAQMILPEKIRQEIDEALRVIENREQVYEIWGFGEVEPTPKSILNFYGPPGTGKTMCAHAIAHKLGKKLLALNYSEIESKYVGDAPKNLAHAFDTAKETDSVMFFDEADSFLGKRIENVSQGAEQALNSLRSQMLIKLEEFSGIVLFATNLVTNFDHAFESRILKHIEFELPNKEARAAIIRKMIPSKLPLEKEITEDELLDASEIIDGFSGREIKGAMLEMLLSRAGVDNDHKFSIEDIKLSLKGKKESIDRLKEQETQRLKDKIMKSANEQAEIAHAKNEELKKLEEKVVASEDKESSQENND